MAESLFSLACYFPPEVVLYLNSILDLLTNSCRWTEINVLGSKTYVCFMHKK